MPYCPNCAAQVLADDRFCSACGKAITPNPRVPTEASKTPAPVGEDAATTETATTPTTDTGKRPLRKIGYGCLTALALVIALAFGLASWGTNDAKAAARGHLDLIKNGQVALAYQQTSPDLQALAAAGTVPGSDRCAATAQKHREDQLPHLRARERRCQSDGTCALRGRPDVRCAHAAPQGSGAVAADRHRSGPGAGG